MQIFGSSARENIKLTFSYYKLHPRSWTVCPWKDDPFLFGAERSLFKARKGLRKFGGICNCDSLTAKASGFATRKGVNRDEDVYLMFIKMKRYCTFAGFLWIKHICRNYPNICTVKNMCIIIYIYTYIYIQTRRGLRDSGRFAKIYLGCICVPWCQWIVRIQKRPMTGMVLYRNPTLDTYISQNHWHLESGMLSKYHILPTKTLKWIYL